MIIPTCDGENAKYKRIQFYKKLYYIITFYNNMHSILSQAQYKRPSGTRCVRVGITNMFFFSQQ